MPLHERLTEFYRNHLPDGTMEGTMLKADCPFCREREKGKSGRLVVYLNARGYFAGYFRCLNRCVPGGFAPHFARLLGLDPALVPDHDPEREPYIADEDWPLENLNQEIDRLHGMLTPEMRQYFANRGIGLATLRELKIGFNGRYLVYPYFHENDCCYAAHCLPPTGSGEQFWMGDERFTTGGQRIFNLKDINRCEDGALFVAEGEANYLCLRELGYPGVAVPAAADLEMIDIRRFAQVKTIFLVMKNSPESDMAARTFASRLGFRVRLMQWPAGRPRGFDLTALARKDLQGFKSRVTGMISAARAYSPFREPGREYRLFREDMARQQSKDYRAMLTGFPRLDRAMHGVHGLNVIGGPPKSGKSCLALQFATEISAREVPVIYYDFENGRQKIYQRTLARLSRLPVDTFTAGDLDGPDRERFEGAANSLQALLEYFRVVNDRKLTPEIMRRHIDFLRHETGSENAVVVIDSLHKLPFKDFAERRTGIDAWLREMESIRDELRAAFLVISELQRQEGGTYDATPHMGLFKGSGDIEYTADNALIFLPEWRVEEMRPETERRNALWLVASREFSPGLIARYRLDFPYWGFVEEKA